MRFDPTLLIAGFAAAGIEILVARMLAPFFGLGALLATVLLIATLLALALGLVIGGSSARSFEIGWPLAAAGAWLVLAIGTHGWLFPLLERFGLLPAAIIAASILVMPPLVLIGALLPVAVRDLQSGAPDAARAVGTVWALFALGAALAAWVVPFVALPSLGLFRTAIALGVVVIAIGVIDARVNAGRRAVVVIVAALAVVAIGWLAARPAKPPAGVVAQAFSEGRDLRVLNHQGSHYLLVDGTIHDVIEPATGTGMRRAEAALRLFHHWFTQPGRVLVIGLRGGALARSFFRAGWTVDVVEPDRGRAAMVRERLGLLPGEARVVTLEPRVALRQEGEGYDVVVIDAFGDNFITPELVTRECFALAKQRLFQGGMLAVVIETMGWEDVVIRSLAATAATEFDSVLALPTGEPPNALGSVILVAADRPLELDRETLPQPFENLADPIDHWNAVQVTHAWDNRFVPERRGVPVLTDDRNASEMWGERINIAARAELHEFFGPRARYW